MDKPIKLLFLTDNFPPEVNAPATRTFEHCREWVESGVDVTIITCAPNFPTGVVYPGYHNKFFQKEFIAGIKVIRVWSYMASNQGTLKRILDYISFGVSSFFAGLFIKSDLIIATSPQFFTAISGFALSVFKRRPWVMEVRDLWPESIRAVNAMTVSTRLWDWIESIELFLYRKAKKIIVVTDSFKDNLTRRGIDQNKIHIIKNGVLIDAFNIHQDNENLKDKYPQLNGKFVIGYLGTHGMAHKLDFILRCAKKVITQNDLHFLFIGDGAEKSSLLKIKDQLRLDNVTMLPAIAKKDIVAHLSMFNAALIPLKKSDLFRTVIPSKIFESAAMRIPIILGVQGESQALIENYHAGICFEPENEQAFLESIFKLKADQKLYARLQTGCEQLALDFDRKKLAQEMLTAMLPKEENKI